MSTKHKIIAEQSLYACEVPLLTFQAEITFTWQPESGDGWNEPRTGEFAEFDGVTQLSGPEIADADLAEPEPRRDPSAGLRGSVRVGRPPCRAVRRHGSDGSRV
jgi:hypothetical protein